MAQVTLYLDRETASRTKKAAKAAGLSQSRWVAELVRQKTLGEWPRSVERLSGAWADAPTAQRLRRSKAKDAPRQPF
jgi:hypothetical protein